MCNLVTIIGECEWIRFLRMPSCSYLWYLISRISMVEPSFIWSNNGVAVFSLSMLLSCSVCSTLFQFNPIEFRWRLVLNWIDLKVPLDCHSIFSLPGVAARHIYLYHIFQYTFSMLGCTFARAFQRKTCLQALMGGFRFASFLCIFKWKMHF